MKKAKNILGFLVLIIILFISLIIGIGFYATRNEDLTIKEFII